MARGWRKLSGNVTWLKWPAAIGFGVVSIIGVSLTWKSMTSVAVVFLGSWLSQ